MISREFLEEMGEGLVHIGICSQAVLEERFKVHVDALALIVERRAATASARGRARLSSLEPPPSSTAALELADRAVRERLGETILFDALDAFFYAWLDAIEEAARA